MTVWADYYHGDYPQPMGWLTCVKAGEGLSFTDPRYRAWTDRSATGSVTAYYALHPTRAADQARRAASLVGTRPTMFDVERWPAESGSPAGIASVPDVCAAVDTFRGVGGVMHVIYLPRSAWVALGRPSLGPLVDRGLHVINADYRPGASKVSSDAWQPYGGATPFAVQYAPMHNFSALTEAAVSAVWNGAVAPTGPATPRLKGYIVRAGDSLTGIAVAHGMSLAELVRYNPHAGHPAGHYNTIWPGDHLTVRA